MARKKYVRIRFKPHQKRAQWYWAVKLGPQKFKRVKRDGDTCMSERRRKDGTIVCREELLIGKPLEERKARMNLKYAELEEE